ncbi:MAG: hypothetical protein FJY10_07250 [Bacteroidetes bacterium]|nr:hypothetical protein [Bacteroidota bacterium]
MKTKILLIAFLMNIPGLFAQVPDAFTCQTVVRDPDGNLMTNRSLAFRITLIRDSVDGETVYAEIQNVISNAYGLAEMLIGRGVPITGDIESVAWGNHSHFIQTEIDTAGGTNFERMGISQLISVPYSLFAKRAAPSHVAGSGIEVRGDTIINANPDRDVVLNPGAAIHVSGTYPEFTIDNTAPDVPVDLSPGAGILIDGGYPSFTITNTSPDEVVVLLDGTGISVSGTYPIFTVTNTLPDQVVNMTSGPGIDVSGTYPDFMVANTAPDQIVSLTNGSGIGISGSYPSFIITNTSPNVTHTGDATGSSALTVVKIQGRSVSATAPTTSYALKWTGTEWAPQADVTRDGCPSGYTSINSQYCIQTNMFDWTSRSWFGAIDICGDNGARLCSWAEWYNACVNGVGLSYMLNYLQWVDDGVSTANYARVTGGTTCAARDNKDVDVSTNATYTRCCFSK